MFIFGNMNFATFHLKTTISQVKIKKFKIPLGNIYKLIRSIFGENKKRKDWNTTWRGPENPKKLRFLQKRVFAVKTQKLK
jgi:hypothetical protein